MALISHGPQEIFPSDELRPEVVTGEARPQARKQIERKVRDKSIVLAELVGVEMGQVTDGNFVCLNKDEMSTFGKGR